MTIFDQYEVESLLAHSGSIFDAVLFGGIYSGSSNIPELEKILVGSTVKAPTLLAITGSTITTASLRVFTYNSDTSSIPLGDPVKLVPMLASDLARFYKNSYVGTSAKYSLAFNSRERFTDSVMPEPFLVYATGTADPSGLVSMHYPLRHRAINQNVTSSCMIICSHLPPAETGTDGPVTNIFWQNDFPFEPKYKNIARNPKIESQIIEPPWNVTVITDNSPFFGAWTFDFSTPPSNRIYKNSLVYWGFHALSFGYSSVNTSLPANTNAVTRSYWELEDFAFSGSLTSSAGKVLSLPWVSGVAQPPTAEMFNLHFFGFGKMFGKFAEPGIITASIATAAVTESAPLREYLVTTGTFAGIRLDGYKFGVYSPIPAYSKAVFRRNHFGFFRDMLEQRPNTTFFDERRGVSLETAITINFLTTSQAYLTASSPDPYLNARSSGMFDFGYRAGRPFFE